jgi:pSer/pThr/pTyr-binding forkhead associated (FHA) protein
VATKLPTANQSVAELQRQVHLEREGGPFLVHRAGSGEQVLTSLTGRERVTIGREPGCDIDLTGDPEASRLHAEIELIGGAWVIADDGLSRNGTFVNGERIQGRRRLADRDLVLAGGTGVLFRDPAAAQAAGAPAPDPTVAAAGGASVPELGDTQRKVLLALCRPLAAGPSYAAAPASNQEIADEVVISVAAVKSNLRVLFTKFGVDAEPQNRKRAALADRALASGVIHPSDFS